MWTNTGSANRAIATLAPIASKRAPPPSERFRRASRTESTRAIAATTISSSPRFENGFGIGRRLYPGLNAAVRTRTMRYARSTHHAGRSSGRKARNSRPQVAKCRVVPPAGGVGGTVSGAQFLRVLLRRPETLGQRTSGLGRNLSEVVFEIFQQDLRLIRREGGKRGANRGRIGRDVVCLIVTFHDRCSFRSGDG